MVEESVKESAKRKGCRVGFTLTAGETSAHIWRLRVTSAHLNLKSWPAPTNPAGPLRPARAIPRSRAVLKSLARGGPPHFAGHYSSLRVIPIALLSLLFFSLLFPGPSTSSLSGTREFFLLFVSFFPPPFSLLLVPLYPFMKSCAGDLGCDLSTYRCVSRPTFPLRSCRRVFNFFPYFHPGFFHRGSPSSFLREKNLFLRNRGENFGRRSFHEQVKSNYDKGEIKEIKKSRLHIYSLVLMYSTFVIESVKKKSKYFFF